MTQGAEANPMTSPTGIDLEALSILVKNLERLERKATQGEWCVYIDLGKGYVLTKDGGSTLASELSISDIDFIVPLRNTAKALIAAVRELSQSRALAAFQAEQIAGMTTLPIDMVLYCPSCGEQHVDEPDERTPDWKNPPHKSHLCHGCGCIWRPADVPTNGVASIKTSGKADTWIGDTPNRAAKAAYDATQGKPTDG